MGEYVFAGRRRAKVLLGIAAAVVALLSAVSPAMAADSGLKGTITDPTSDAGIAGVVIKVEGVEFTGTATTNAEG